MVKLRIKKDLEWGEYIVQWVENGKVDEDKSYYAGGLSQDEAKDAAYSLRAMIEEARGKGYEIEPNQDKKTLDLLSKYVPGFLVSETRAAVEESNLGMPPRLPSEGMGN
jgi:hypothetical protein